MALRINIKTVFAKAYSVPYALRERVKKEFDSLEKENFIIAVATSDCNSPLVVISKPDAEVSIYVD